jgi:hypothetical protein
MSKIPNKDRYGWVVLLRRWWREITCTHWNATTEWSDGQGHNIMVCNVCHRAKIYADCHREHAFDNF